MLLVQNWLLFQCSNKKQSNKNEYHFHFSLDDFGFFWGEALLCYWKALLLYSVIVERFFY